MEATDFIYVSSVRPVKLTMNALFADVVCCAPINRLARNVPKLQP
jgi:hypothetical protein